MIHLLTQLAASHRIVGNLNALERWESAQSGIRQPPSSPEWMWLAPALAAVAVLAGVLWWLHRCQAVRERQQRFFRRGKDLGLRAEETATLWKLAQKASLRSRETIYVARDIFEAAVAKVLACEEFQSRPVLERERFDATLLGIREKLAFHPAASLARAEPNTRQIAPGDGLVFRCQLTGQIVPAKVSANTDDHLLVELESAGRYDLSGGWIIRYPVQDSVWEFDLSLMGRKDNAVQVAHSRDIRLVNRRRFIRAKAQRPAYVARFPFLQLDSQAEPPFFAPAQVVQIAGPGIQLVSRLDVQQRERVLLVMKLREQRVVQGIGVVRRIEQLPDGTTSFCVELLGLSDAELAELTRQTVDTSRRANDRGPAIHADESPVTARRPS